MLERAGVDGTAAIRRLRRRSSRGALSPHHSRRAAADDAPLRRRRRSIHRSTPPTPRAGSIDAGLESAFLDSSAKDAALVAACGSRVRSRSRPASSRASSPGRSTPSTRRSPPRRWRACSSGAGSGRWCRSSGSLATTTTSPRRARHPGRPRTAVWSACRSHHAPADAPLTPMYREPLGARARRRRWTRLAADLPAGEFRDSTLEWLRRHYRPEATVAGAFGGALAELLAPAGIVCLDSAHPAVKRAAAPLILRALEEAARARRRPGPPVARSSAPGRARPASPWETARRSSCWKVPKGATGWSPDEGGFVTRRARERFALEELRRIAATEPTRLSPNVLLRPVVESALLPTVAYVAGPGELRYLALTPPVYERLGVARQRPIPRWSGVLVEPKVDRVLEKFGVTLEDLLEPDGALEARLVRSQLPARPSKALERTARRARGRLRGPGTKRGERSTRPWPGRCRGRDIRRSPARRRSRRSWCSTSSGGRRPSWGRSPGRAARCSRTTSRRSGC